MRVLLRQRVQQQLQRALQVQLRQLAQVLQLLAQLPWVWRQSWCWPNQGRRPGRLPK
jgi:hypothetical protein